MKNLIVIFAIIHFSLFTIHSFSQSCLPEGIIFTTQAEIDSFQINYPYCTQIEGDVTINGSDITNLNGLLVLTSIGGDLEISYCDALTSLTGLDNVTAIGGNLYLHYNNALTSLTGLDNVTAIGGDIHIVYNDSLSTCEAQSLCNYLANPNGSVTIYGNATGCNSPLEVAANCGITLPCLPYGNYYFLTQEQIDNFQTNYPGCNEIEGDVTIYGDDIINLDGLTNITTIGGTLQIGNNINMSGANPVLVSLDGLSSLSAVGGDLRILGNDIIVDLSGLESLTSVGGSLVIGDWWNTWPCANLSLLSLDGLDNLASVGEGLQIFGGIVEDISALSGLTIINSNVFMQYVPSLPSLDGLNNISSIGGSLRLGDLGLTNLSGLDNLSYIAGDFTLYGNDSLISLSGPVMLDSIGGHLGISSNGLLENMSGLENLTSIGGNLGVSFNDTLTSLAGLENINAASINSLGIRNNKLLSTCEVQSICEYLANPGGWIEIYGNAPGCNSPGEIAHACGFPMPCLPYGDYYFVNQSEVDSFQVYYPGCTALEGNVRIGGQYSTLSNIENLYGLDAISSIEGSLTIQFNDSLASLSGLDNLVSIGGKLSIYHNDALTSLTGLDNLTSMGGGYLSVDENDALTSLTGIDNIEAGTISNLYITRNPLLAECNVLSICNYLSAPGGTVEIQYNAPGCNDPDTVLSACIWPGVEESAVGGQRSAVRVYPNPTSGVSSFWFLVPRNI